MQKACLPLFFLIALSTIAAASVPISNTSCMDPQAAQKIYAHVKKSKRVVTIDSEYEHRQQHHKETFPLYDMWTGKEFFDKSPGCLSSSIEVAVQQANEDSPVFVFDGTCRTPMIENSDKFLWTRHRMVIDAKTGNCMLGNMPWIEVYHRDSNTIGSEPAVSEDSLRELYREAGNAIVMEMEIEKHFAPKE